MNSGFELLSFLLFFVSSPFFFSLSIFCFLSIFSGLFNKSRGWNDERILLLAKAIWLQALPTEARTLFTNENFHTRLPFDSFIFELLLCSLKSLLFVGCQLSCFYNGTNVLYILFNLADLILIYLHKYNSF